MTNLSRGYFQGGRGHWAVYETSPQSLIIMFSYSFAQQFWGLLFNLIYFSLCLCPNVCNVIEGVILWGGTSIYRPLSHPFISLGYLDNFLNFIFAFTKDLFN